MKSIAANFIFLLLLTFFVSNPNSVFAQHNHKHGHESQLQQLVPSIPYLVYDNSDSLSGFNEGAAFANAITEGFSEENTARYIYLRKREYIKTKYGINSNSVSKDGLPTVQAPCTNIDFETGTTGGWTTSGDAVIKSGAGTDPFGGFPVVAPGGAFSLQLGNNTNVATSIANQTFSVTPANAYFVLKFAMVILNFPHTAPDAARVFIRFRDGAGAIIACPNFECYYAETSAGGGQSYGLTGFQTGANGVNIGAQSYPTTYVPWTNLGFDLTPYVGQNVTVEIENRWCVYNYDWAYCYVDGLCSTLTTSVTGGCSGVTTGTLTAPAGMDNYAWAGPAGSSVSSITTQTATTTTPGIYTVTCTPYSSCGAATYVYTLNFSPNAAPTADFNYTVTPCASSFSVPVISTSSPNGGGPITSYTWDWGDATPFGTGASTVHTYGTIGTKTVELKVSNGACTDSITKTFSFSVGPAASFTNSSGCLNTATSFSSTTTPTAGITAHQWDFGDGSALGSGANPVHTYTTSGSKVVTYTVVSAACTSSITHTITVYPNPTAAITGNTVCLNVGTTFGNTSSVAAPDNITGWAWDFNNDGTVDNTTQTPGNTYATAGTYTVELRATTNNGCMDSTSIVVKVNPLPTATFTPGNACLNNNVALNNTSSIAAPDNIATYAWNFGAGASPATSTVTNPSSLVYTTSGPKNITLNLISNNTCTATITQTIMVNAQPVANFSTTSVCQGTATAYTDLSTCATGTIIAWQWDFTNNGSIDNATPAPTNMFPSPGTPTTNLIVTDSNGCKDTISLTVNVWGHAVPDFVPNNVCLGTASSFSNTTNYTVNINTGGTPTWAWNFGDGIGTSTNQDPTYTYAGAGGTSYNVTLTVTTTNGCIDQAVKTVTVNALPTATFTPVNACLNTNVLLNNTSNIPAPDNISAYAWNFGAGAAPATTSSVQNPPLLTYNSSGVKVITLTVTANTTCSATITQTVTVYPQPVANFSTTSVCQGTATAYTDLSTPTGSITAWSWDFTNNGSPDNATNAPTNTFPASGTFTTGLIVTDNNTCKDTIALPLNVWGHTVPDFTPDKVCFGTASVFTNLTNEAANPNTGTGSTYVWDFADLTPTTTIVNPSHTYVLGGNVNAVYNVTLTVTSLHNCVDFIVKPVSVYAIPTASFTSDSVCLGSPSQMTDASNGNGNTVNTYEWDYLMNGTVDVTGVANPNFVFPAFGNNSVSYTVSTSPVVGLVCSNTTNTIQVWVNPNPIPDFTFVNNCINAQPNTFNGSPSMIAIGTNTTFVWAYGDGAVSTPTAASTSNHTYGAAGVYNVTLTLTSNKGCQSAISHQVEVYEKPHMAITNSPACDQTAMTFTATQQAGSGTVTQWFWDFNNSITSIEGNGQTTNFTFTGPGDYTIHLVSETNHGCRDTIQKGVYVDYMPTPMFTVNDPNGCPTHCVTFTDLTPTIPGPGQLMTWTWDLGDGSNPTVNNTNATVDHCYNNNSSSQLALYTIKLTVTSSAGCTASLTQPNYVTVYPKPIANYVANPNPSNVIEPLVFFTNQSIDYTNWQWMFGDGSPRDSVNVDPEHFYSEATAQTYYTALVVSNQYGCLDTAYLPVEIGPEFTFYIPNAFSPSNDDGVNDYFNGTGIGIATYEMFVFDRWGERVFYTDDIKKGWNGKVQGKSKEGKQEVYVWKVKLTDVLGKKHEYMGHVTLLK